MKSLLSIVALAAALPSARAADDLAARVTAIEDRQAIEQLVMGDYPRALDEQRLKDYHREFDMISAYYPNAKIVKIDGTKPEEVMWESVRQALDQAGIHPAHK